MTEEGARLRNGPDLKAKILGKVAVGQNFAAKKIGDDWVQILTGPHAGKYIAAKLVQITELD